LKFERRDLVFLKPSKMTGKLNVIRMETPPKTIGIKYFIPNVIIRNINKIPIAIFKQFFMGYLRILTKYFCRYHL